ncbi:MAG: hypothetical protein ACYTG5_04540 [Planctomycetota bacterium]
MHRLIVSAPFGNYIQPEGATATLGTFTAKERPGRLWRIIKTLRFYPRLRAWVNQIGLRNPGMPWLVERVRSKKIDVGDKIVSIHGFDAAEWQELLTSIKEIRPLAVELNLSCPNVGEINWPPELFSWAMASDVQVIAKLPPVQYELILEQALAAGIRNFHCCNTLPIPAGGLSGSPLKPVALACIRRVQELAPESLRSDLRFIGGGGIRNEVDIDEYAAAGVHHVAIGTKVMNPRYLLGHGPLRALIAHAERSLVDRDRAG